MMFRSILSKSLRDYRIPLLCWGGGLALLMLAGFASATPVVITAFSSIAPLLTFLGDPMALSTPGGYMTFRYLETVMPILFGLWPILAGARMVRGEEEQGMLDVLLATPYSRARLLLEKVMALLIVLLLVALLLALGIIGGEARLGIPRDAVGALLAGLNLSAFSFFFGMLALLISQFTTSRGTAAGITSGLLLLVLLLDVTGREVHGSWAQYLSPLYYYNLNRPLITGFSGQPVAAVLLPMLSLLCLLASLLLFARRDIGRTAFSWPRRVDHHLNVAHSLEQAERSLASRSVATQTLATQGRPAFWWLLGMVLFCAYCAMLVPGIQAAFEQIVRQTPWLQALFFDTPTNSNAALLGTLLFSSLPPLVVMFALTQALQWSADLENGRLELIFSTPNSRLRMLLERYGATLLLVLLAPLLAWMATMLGALLLGLSVNQQRMSAASFSILPMALITLGMVYALAGRLRYGQLPGLVSTYLVFSFLEESFEGLVPIPSFIGWLSIFHLYGNPIFQDLDWGKALGMTLVGLLLLVIGLLQFRTADIARG